MNITPTYVSYPNFNPDVSLDDFLAPAVNASVVMIFTVDPTDEDAVIVSGEVGIQSVAVEGITTTVTYLIETSAMTLAFAALSYMGFKPTSIVSPVPAGTVSAQIWTKG